MSTNNIDELQKIITESQDGETHIDGDGIYWDECFPRDGNAKYKKVGRYAWGGNPSVRALPDIRTIIEQADKIESLEKKLFESNREAEKAVLRAAEMLVYKDDKIAELKARTECTVEGFDLTKRDLEIKRKGFWLGFEDARCHPDEMNILKQWQCTLVFNQAGVL
jgi:hypothetical protein